MADSPSTLVLPSRIDVQGVGLSVLDLATATGIVVAAAREARGGTVTCLTVHGVVEARRDPAVRRAMNGSLLTTPDGMPLVWLLRRAGHRGAGRVYGPDLFDATCAATAGTGLAHGFCGGAPGVAAELAGAMSRRHPGLRVAGTWCPPFRATTEAEDEALAGEIRAAGVAFLWVGLGTPKQDLFMARLAPRLPGVVLLGVGAAFDFFTGRVRQAPRWVQRSGLEWLFRLACEPRRLARRYLTTNPVFLWGVVRQELGWKPSD